MSISKVTYIENIRLYNIAPGLLFVIHVIGTIGIKLFVKILSGYRDS